MAAETPNSLDAQEITRRLHEWRSDKRESGDEIIGMLYPELRRLAAHYMQMERPGHTLQPTALVHELYVKLMSGTTADWRDRAHFLAFAARKLRHILVDHARRIRASERSLQEIKLLFREEDGWTGRDEAGIMALDEALTHLEEVDNRACRVLELRFFAGLTEAEVGEVLEISVPTVKRDFTFARVWLATRLTAPPAI